MSTITNSTNYIEISDGVSGAISIPKDMISEVKLKSDRIVIFRVEGPPIDIYRNAISLPVSSSLTDLYNTIKGYL